WNQSPGGPLLDRQQRRSRGVYWSIFAPALIHRRHSRVHRAPTHPNPGGADAETAPPIHTAPSRRASRPYDDGAFIPSSLVKPPPYFASSLSTYGRIPPLR